MHPTLYSAIKEHRRKMRPGQRKASLNTKFTWKYPYRAEKRAEDYVSHLFVSVAGPTMFYLKKHIPDFEVNRGVLRIDTSEQEMIESLDTFSTLASTGIDSIKQKDSDAILLIIVGLLLSEWDRYTTLYAGVPVAMHTDLEIYKQEFLIQLRKMLSTEVTAFYTAAKTLLGNALASKEIYQKTYTQIFERFKRLVITRAKYVARNLISNTQSHLSQLLFTVAGIPNYIWVVNMDEVLRGNPSGKYANKIPSHYVMSGIICTWSNDGVYSLDGTTWIPRTEMMEFKAPGRAVNCRCMASPFIRKDLVDIDNAT